MIRRLVAGLIVVGLAVGIWALWPRADPDTTPTTLPVAVETTTTATSTTVVGTTTTSEEVSHVVTTVEEAEAILRELWFGWFEGIYNQDEERIKEVVGTQAMLDSARNAFGSLVFVNPPAPNGLTVVESEILLSTETCLVVWSASDATFLEAGEPREGVDVMRRDAGSWLFVSSWVHRDDLWEADCEAELEPFS